MRRPDPACLACAPLDVRRASPAPSPIKPPASRRPAPRWRSTSSARSTGLELIDQAKSDAQGNFTINQTPQGPHLIRTAFDGVTYNHMLPPGRPPPASRSMSTTLRKQPGDAKVAKHMILFEPSGAGRWRSTRPTSSRTTARRPGTIRTAARCNSSCPPGAEQARGEGHRARRHAARRAGRTRPPSRMCCTVDFADQARATRAIDVTYTVPYTDGADLRRQGRQQGRQHLPDRAQRRHMKGDGLNDLGTEPRTQAHIFGLHRRRLQSAADGRRGRRAGRRRRAASRRPTNPARTSSRSCRAVNSKTISILVVALGILALGFALLVSRESAGAAARRHAGMNAVAVEGVWKFYGDYPALRDVELSGGAGRVPGADRPQRRGQDHAAAHHRGLFAARQGQDPDLRQLAARDRDAPPDGLHRPRHLASTTSFRRSRI